MTTPSKLLLAALLTVAIAVGVGCGDDDGGGGGGGEAAGGGTASKVDLSGASFTVGSKEFTEQLVLGQITIQALEAAGAKVKDQTGLEGSVAARKALTSGDIDMYWEYTGTGWVNYLRHDKGVPDAQKQFQSVKEEDAKNDVAWMKAAPMNNTYAFAVRSDAGADLDQVQSLSDLAALAKSKPELATLCVGEEFATRSDGLPGVEKAYDFKFPEDQVSLVGDAVVYDQTAKGDRCNFGSVFSTDGRIKSKNLRVLKDDRSFFPYFNAALTVRQSVLTKYPQLTELFAPISAALTDKEATALNARVDVDGETPEDVAGDFLSQHGVVK